VLSKGEIYAAKRAIPAALTAMHSVSKGQFMLECEGQRPCPIAWCNCGSGDMAG
jgi:hypothetical protein